MLGLYCLCLSNFFIQTQFLLSLLWSSFSYLFVSLASLPKFPHPSLSYIANFFFLSIICPEPSFCSIYSVCSEFRFLIGQLTAIILLNHSISPLSFSNPTAFLLHCSVFCLTFLTRDDHISPLPRFTHQIS